MGIQDNADKVLKALFNKYLRTGINDFCNIDTISDLPSSENTSAARHLKSLGYVKDNTLGNLNFPMLELSIYQTNQSSCCWVDFALVRPAWA